MADVLFSMESLTILGMFRDGATIHGYRVCQETGLSIGTVYKALHKMASRGMLAAREEVVDQRQAPRVPKVMYSITTDGIEQIRQIRLALGTS